MDTAPLGTLTTPGCGQTSKRRGDAEVGPTWETARPMMFSRRLLALFFSTMGALHFAIPRQFEAIVPKGIPAKQAVAVSGVAEIAGGLAVLHPSTRPLARW